MTSVTVYATSNEGILNWKGCRMKRSWPNLTYCIFIYSKKLRNPQKDFSQGSRLAEIGNWHLQNTSRKRNVWAGKLAVGFLVGAFTREDFQIPFRNVFSSFTMFRFLLRPWSVFLNHWDTFHQWSLSIGWIRREVSKVIINSAIQNSPKNFPAF
jgi:hypothetical protein